ncbi:hypothetical protein YPPY53_4808, partial [Yersinia pestis PY-53]
MLPSLLAKK